MCVDLQAGCSVLEDDRSLVRAPLGKEGVSDSVHWSTAEKHIDRQAGERGALPVTLPRPESQEESKESKWRIAW